MELSSELLIKILTLQDVVLIEAFMGWGYSRRIFNEVLSLNVYVN